MKRYRFVSLTAAALLLPLALAVAQTPRTKAFVTSAVSLTNTLGANPVLTTTANSNLLNAVEQYGGEEGWAIQPQVINATNATTVGTATFYLAGSNDGVNYATNSTLFVTAPLYLTTATTNGWNYPALNFTKSNVGLFRYLKLWAVQWTPSNTVLVITNFTGRTVVQR
jgi:hypothetical protein